MCSKFYPDMFPQVVAIFRGVYLNTKRRSATLLSIQFLLNSASLPHCAVFVSWLARDCPLLTRHLLDCRLDEVPVNKTDCFETASDRSADRVRFSTGWFVMPAEQLLYDGSFNYSAANGCNTLKVRDVWLEIPLLFLVTGSSFFSLC
jgi:hypothetical protein